MLYTIVKPYSVELNMYLFIKSNVQ